MHGVSKDSVASLPPDSCKEAKQTPVPEDQRLPLPTSASIRDVYDHKVKYHDLSSDPHQENVVQRSELSTLRKNCSIDQEIQG